MATVTTLPVPLSFLLAERSGEKPIAPFSGTLHGVPIVVTAVMERSVVYEVATEEWPRRELGRPAEVLVGPLELRWRPQAKDGGKVPTRWNGQRLGRPKLTAEERAERERIRNEGVLANRAKVEADRAARREADRAAARAAVEARRAQEEAMKQPVAVEVLAPSTANNPDLGGMLTVTTVTVSQTCKVCLLEKPIERFIRSPFGISQTCRDCAGKKKSETHKKQQGPDPLFARLRSLKAHRDRALAAAAAAREKADSAHAAALAAREKAEAAESAYGAVKAELQALHERLAKELES